MSLYTDGCMRHMTVEPVGAGGVYVCAEAVGAAGVCQLRCILTVLMGDHISGSVIRL
jgi:hypothetical protein